jgi:hypothetical protein
MRSCGWVEGACVVLSCALDQTLSPGGPRGAGGADLPGQGGGVGGLRSHGVADGEDVVRVIQVPASVSVPADDRVNRRRLQWAYRDEGRRLRRRFQFRPECSTVIYSRGCSHRSISRLTCREERAKRGKFSSTNHWIPDLNWFGLSMWLRLHIGKVPSGHYPSCSQWSRTTST